MRYAKARKSRSSESVKPIKVSTPGRSPRASGNAGNAAITAHIQRFSEEKKAKGFGTAVNEATKVNYTGRGKVYIDGSDEDHSLTFAGWSAEELALPEGCTGGRIELEVSEKTEIDNLVSNDSETASSTVSVPFTVVDDVLTFGSVSSPVQASGSGATMTISGQTSTGQVPPSKDGGTRSASFGTLQVNTSVTAASSKGTYNVGASLGMQGGSGVSGGLGVGYTTGSVSNTGQVSLALAVKLTVAPFAPVLSMPVFFAVNSSEWPDSEVGKLQSWFASLGSDVAKAVQRGSLKLSTTGFCSPTGGFRRNTDLSVDRGRTLAAALQGVAGSKTDIQSFGAGRTPGGKEKEEPLLRCGIVKVSRPNEVTASTMATLPAVGLEPAKYVVVS